MLSVALSEHYCRGRMMASRTFCIMVKHIWNKLHIDDTCFYAYTQGYKSTTFTLCLFQCLHSQIRHNWSHFPQLYFYFIFVAIRNTVSIQQKNVNDLMSLRLYTMQNKISVELIFAGWIKVSSRLTTHTPHLATIALGLTGFTSQCRTHCARR